MDFKSFCTYSYHGNTFEKNADTMVIVMDYQMCNFKV